MAFQDPFAGVVPDRKLSDEELVRAIRQDLAAEEEATMLYMAHADATSNPLAQRVLRSVADEERVHAGEFHHLIQELTGNEDRLFARGAGEVEAGEPPGNPDGQRSLRRRGSMPIDESGIPGPSPEQRLEAVESGIANIQAQMAVLTGPHVILNAGSIGPEGTVVEGPHAEIVVAEGPPPGMGLSEWVHGINGSPGILVDRELAESTPCLKIELGEGERPLVYSKGIVGALDEDQQERFCAQGVTTKEATPAQKARLTAMREAAHTCALESVGDTTQEHLENYFMCLGKELRSKGLET